MHFSVVFLVPNQQPERLEQLCLGTSFRQYRTVQNVKYIYISSTSNKLKTKFREKLLTNACKININTSCITCLIFLFIWAQSPSLRKLASTCTGWYQPRSSFKFSYSFLSRNIFWRYSHKSLSFSRFFPSLRRLYPSQ